VRGPLIAGWVSLGSGSSERAGDRGLEVVPTAIDETACLDPTTGVRLSVELEIASPPAPVRIVLAGELDGEEVTRLHDAVAGVPLPGDIRDLRIDAGELTFLDSAGIRALLGLRERAADAGARVVIDRLTHNVYRVIEIAGLLDIFQISDPAASG
jgi:anti-anti-sigma factor